MVKNPPAMHEMRLGSLGREDALENEMATHSSILAWEMPWAEEPGGLQSMGPQRIRHNLAPKPPPPLLPSREDPKQASELIASTLCARPYPRLAHGLSWSAHGPRMGCMSQPGAPSPSP